MFTRFDLRNYQCNVAIFSPKSSKHLIPIGKIILLYHYTPSTNTFIVHEVCLDKNEVTFSIYCILLY
jgi:hypothetical protein